MSIFTSNQVIAAQFAEPIAAGIMVASRTVITLKYGKRKLGLADYSILLMYVICVTSAGVLLKQLYLQNKGAAQAKTPYEKALPILALSEKDLNLNMNLLYGGGTLYYFKSWLIKFSLCFTYLELQKYLTKRNKMILYSVMGTTVATLAVALGGWFGTCLPKHISLPLDPNGSLCPTVTPANIWTWFVATITADVALLLFAFLLIASLQLRSGPRIAIMIVILIGIISIVAATIRFAFVVQFLGGKFAANNDPVIATRAATFWAIIETIFGVFAACLPAFRLLFRESMESVTKNGSYGSGNDSRSGGSASRQGAKGLVTSNSDYAELKPLNSTGTSAVSLANSNERNFV